MIRQAVISNGGKYRYTLTRWWRTGDQGMILWVMLNPSTADADKDDNTIRRCISFSRLWGYEAMTVVNLYAYRATKPTELWDRAKQGKDIIGPKNDRWILKEAYHAQRIVVAWGNNADFHRPKVVRKLLGKKKLYCLGTTASGHPLHPLHPLRLHGNTQLQRWKGLP
jgi:hypothetical protein